MAAYMIAEIDITDPQGYQAYGMLAIPTIQKFGGKVLVAGETIENLEGDWHPKRLVIIEFESMEQAKRWYNSEEYTPLKNMRFKATNSRGGLAQGI
ncbi:MAG: DUF1330 domain-containing protein [Ktedonobacteraceae bacterium]